ncbi:MAG TPA: hypothetical protein PKE12_08655 [Kiritimatiellia bacterium]|nr:hypothetical protein [Kiritimatiellia bacterium]
MIVPEPTTTAPRHELEPLVLAAMRANPPASDTMRAAWDSVLQVIDDARQPLLRRPDAAALLFAKALASCQQPEAARAFLAMTPCVSVVADRVQLSSLSLSAIRALASGVIRPIPDSALSPGGLAVVVDGTPFRAGSDFELDFVVLPVLRRLLEDAVEFVSTNEARGVIALRGWLTPTGGAGPNAIRRDAVETMLAQLARGDHAPVLVWQD